MPVRPVSAESWKRMVLRSMPPPAWLSADAPHGDVVLSSRTRIMRNLAGFRFPHTAPTYELEEIQRRVVAAATASANGKKLEPMEVLRHLSMAERDYLVGCRLVSPDFAWDKPGRGLLLDKDRTVSVMVNEEDHIRLQTLTAGWSAATSDGLAASWLERLGKTLEFAWSPRYGFLAASPYNAGQGKRLSAMFHLIGLAHGKRLPSVLRALAARGLVARGLFGESSRAVGAFVQVSITDRTRSEFVGACEYLMREEREARREVGRATLEGRARKAIDFAISSPTLGLADALRVLGWARWAASAGLSGLERSPREVDSWLTALELRAPGAEESAARERADFLRACLES